MLSKRYIFYCMIIATCLSSGSFSIAYAQDPLILAIHPYLPVPEIHTRFTPLADYLQQETGRSVKVRVGGNYEEHISAIGNNKVDIAFLGPAGYVNLVEQFGRKPILARFEVNNVLYLYGVIATRKGSEIGSIESLKDKRFAFGDPGSTMSHVVPRYLLMQAGIPDGAPAYYQFLGSHKNVALGILAGDFDAGAMKQEVFDEFESRGLRALAITPGVPDHLFVTRANLPSTDVERLREALLRLRDVPNGATILRKMHKGLTALVPANDAEYGELRTMMQAVESVSQ